MDRKKVVLLLAAAAALGLIVAAFFVGKSVQRSSDVLALFDYADTLLDDAYKEKLYVIGHKSPDTDAVISAITYANLKQQLGVDCEPAIAGKINNETKYVLERFGVSVPVLLENAAGKNMILVDHSTYTQAIDGMEDTKIVELLDHHGLGDIRTPQPAYVKNLPTGSTATIVFLSYLESGIEIDQTTAGLLLSAILSDTLGLKGSTTTDLDRDVCEYLQLIAGIDDLDGYYAILQEHAESYDGMTDEEIFYSDYKEYEMNGKRVGIACVNAADGRVEELRGKMQQVMQDVYAGQEMEHLYVMLHDVQNDQTVLLYFGDGAGEIAEEAFAAYFGPDGSIVISPAASRKKDVVPYLEEVYSAVKAAA